MLEGQQAVKIRLKAVKIETLISPLMPGETHYVCPGLHYKVVKNGRRKNNDTLRTVCTTAARSMANYSKKHLVHE